jgi:L-fuconolactonase
MTLERKIKMITISDESSDKTKEEILDPELPICDPHHHLWDHPGSRYLLEDLLEDIKSGHTITQTVFVECMSKYRQDGPQEMKPVGETEFVQGIAAESASELYGPTRVASGIVGYADLTLGSAVAKVLEAHLEAGKNRFQGIRHSVAMDSSGSIPAYMNPSEGLLLDSKFLEGFRFLQQYGLSFDAWLYHPQIPELVDLARKFPETQIILDHIGGVIGRGPYSGKREEVFQQWKKGISELSACHNVVVKLGGLGMPLSGFGWNERKTPPESAELAESMAPYYHWCIEQFGVNRCMFESNFPVDKVSYPYGVMWNAFKRVCRGFSAEEKAALFHDTAVRVYRLPDSP